MVVFKILTHTLITLTIFVLLKLPIDAVTVIMVLVGSILPDGDSFIVYLGRLTNNKRLLGYKIFTHSISGIITVILLSILLFTPRISGPLIIGYCMHLIADMFYIEGCTLLYPFKRERRSFSNLKLKGAEEFVCGVILLYVVLSYSL